MASEEDLTNHHHRTKVNRKNAVTEKYGQTTKKKSDTADNKRDCGGVSQTMSV